MIKLFKFIYINPLIFPAFFIFYYAKNLDILLLTYVIMLIHELSHLTVARLIGLRAGYIAIHPFGICLKLKNRIVRTFADEVILYLAGPLSNILMALLAKIFLKETSHFDYIYISNIMLFITNMLPIKPLDGGMIFDRFLTVRIGKKAADRCMKALFIFMSIILVCFCIYQIIGNSFNYSLTVILCLAIGNIFTQSEKYNIDYTKELLYYSEKKELNKQKIKLIAHEKDTDLRITAQNFSPNNYSIVCVIDKNDNIVECLTEKKVLNSLLRNI